VLTRISSLIAPHHYCCRKKKKRENDIQRKKKRELVAKDGFLKKFILKSIIYILNKECSRYLVIENLFWKFYL